MSKSVLDIGKIGKKCEIGAFPNDLLIKDFPSNHSFSDETKLSENGTFDFYRTPVHMGSDHWVAMSVSLSKSFLSLVDDPSEDLN